MRIKPYEAYGAFGIAIAVSSTLLYAYIPVNTTRMRAKPGVTYSGAFGLYSGGYNSPITSFGVSNQSSNAIMRIAVNATGVVAETAYALRANNDADAYIDLIADL